MTEPISVLIWGKPKVGKSSFLLSFPGPIHIFDFDAGLGPLTDPAPGPLPDWATDYPVTARSYQPNPDVEPVAVYVHRFRPPSLAPTPAQFKAMLGEFERRYLALINQTIPCATLGIDADSQFWALVAEVKTEESRLAREEEEFRRAKYRAERAKQPVPSRSSIYLVGEQRDYGLANAYYERAVLGVKGEGINLVLVDRHADIWATDENGRNPAPSGEIKPKGNKLADAFVDLVLRSEWLPGQPEPFGVVELSRFRSLKAGMRVPAPDYSVVSALISAGKGR